MDQYEQEQGEQHENKEQSVAPNKEQFVAVLDEKEQKLIETRKQAEEYLDLLQRTQADFINYRRRLSQEQAEARINAQIEVLNQLLPVLDDVERAMAAIPQDLAKSPWVQGLLLIARRFTAQLDQLGIKRIGSVGEKFDPRLHEAITVESSKDTPEGTILRVAQAGYVLGNRVIRPAQVIVAGAPSPVGGVAS